jgi:hypothetical protein
VSITAVLEINASYIAQLIQAMRDYSIPALDVKQAAANAYAARIQRDLEKTTWHQVSNYWRGNNGKGKIFVSTIAGSHLLTLQTHYPGSVRSLWWDNLSPIWKDYNGAERIVRGQRRRRVFLTLLTLVVLVWSARRKGLTAGALIASATGSANAWAAAAERTVKRVTGVVTQQVGRVFTE